LGRVWIPSNFSNDNFRVRIEATAGVDSIYLDYLEVKVFYTPDTTPASVTINQAAGQIDPTGSAPIYFTVVFSKVMVDFNSTCVVLSGTAGATTAVRDREWDYLYRCGQWNDCKWNGHCQYSCRSGA